MLKINSKAEAITAKYPNVNPIKFIII